jgi:hypothetical protein
MAKKIFLGIFVFVLVLAAGLIAAYFYTNNRVTTISNKTVQQIESQAKPWIEVVRPAVSLLNEDGSEAYQLQTGDEVEVGARIKTNENGLANIYFPNGSVARMDINTEITISDASYNAENQTMVVKIMLGVGRVWSKIFKLATPESSWQVDTTNAVATVRGTAFGVEYENGNTSIVGSENEVAVSFIDPSSRQIINDKHELISPDKVLAINETVIGKVLRGENISLPPIIMAAPNPVLSSEWVKRFKEADALLDRKFLPIRPKINLIRPSALKEVLQGEKTAEQVQTDVLPAATAAPAASADTATSDQTATTTQSPTGAVMQPSGTASSTNTVAPVRSTTILTKPASINLLNQTAPAVTTNQLR